MCPRLRAGHTSMGWWPRCDLVIPNYSQALTGCQQLLPARTTTSDPADGQPIPPVSRSSFGARHAQHRSCGRVRHHAHAVDPLVDGLVRRSVRQTPLGAGTATHSGCHRRLGRNLSRAPERTSAVSAQWVLPTPLDRLKTAQRIGQLRKGDLDQRRPGRRALHHHKSCVTGAHSSIPLSRRIGRHATGGGLRSAAEGTRVGHRGRLREPFIAARRVVGVESTSGPIEAST